MPQTSEAKGEGDPIKELARIARVIVTAEIAYDIPDTLASKPRDYEEPLYRLSRLAAKLARDLEKVKVKEATAFLEEMKKKFPFILEEVFDFLKEHEDKLEFEVRRLAALIVAPDERALNIRDLLHGGR